MGATVRGSRPKGPADRRRGWTPNGPAIDGVLVRPLRIQADDRGEVTELLSQSWPEAAHGPPPHVYASTLEPGVIKGSVAHCLQHERIATLGGWIRRVLCDGRGGSPTCGVVQILTITERNPALLVLPPGVRHAAQNLGRATAWFVNLPTRAARHDDPDKYRLPLDTDEIPFRFAGAPR